MLARYYHSFKTALDEEGIIFSFSGYMSEKILSSLGEALRQKMTLEEADITVVKKVFSVFIEQAQNIIRYSAEKVSGQTGEDIELSSGIVTIGNKDGRFFIACANMVRQTEVPGLKQRLETLQAMSKDELKAHYKEQLREAPADTSRGATLGLIEIARRASEPIQFDFKPVDDQNSLFCLKVLI